MADIRAECGSAIKAGDRVQSSYGIPPTRIMGTVGLHEGKLVVHVDPPHQPSFCTLTHFKKFLGVLYKEKKCQE